MSLFENDEYQWRETYFIFFRDEERPSAELVRQLLQSLDPRYEITDVRADEAGILESLTLLSPDDYAAMDISFVAGEEVAEQMEDLLPELKRSVSSSEEKALYQQLPQCNCRFDVYHFEQLVFVGRDDEMPEDDFMDPGALLMVMQKIAELCNGIVVDPQANCFI